MKNKKTSSYSNYDEIEETEIGVNPFDEEKCDVYYENHDYLQIIMCEIFLCHSETNYKIFVTDQDEPKVIEFLKYMKKKACDQIYRI